MSPEKPTLNYETSEFVEPKRRWLPGLTIAVFAVGCVAGFIVIFPIAARAVSLGSNRLLLLIVVGLSLIVGLAFAVALGRQPRRRRIAPPPTTERVIMMRCRDCGQLTPHTVRRSSAGQCTVECNEFSARRAARDAQC